MSKAAGILVLTTILALPGCGERPAGESRELSPEALLGTGRGLDHVMVAVRDLEAAETLFTETLGFRAGHRAQLKGLENLAVWFSDTTYLELLTVRDQELAMELIPSLPAFLERHEGAMGLGLAVSSAQAAADLLAARGFAITGPSEGSVSYAESEEPVVIGRYVVFREPVVPANDVFFFEYDTTMLADLAALYPERAPMRFTNHPNTALGLEAVWMAVRDLKAAADAYASVELPTVRRLDMPLLGAEAREIQAGLGTILLLQPSDEAGAVASFLAERGEGVMGVSIEVRDLDRVLWMIEFNTDLELVPYDGPFGQSLLIPGELARGIWIEFFKR